MTRRFLFLLVALALSGALAPAADSSKKIVTVPSGQKPRLAFVPNNPSDYWKIAGAGLRKFTAETGVTVDMKTPANGKDPSEQNQIIENLVSQNYNGIAVSAIAPGEQVRLFNRAAKKVNLICDDSDAPKSDRLAYVGTNNYEAGKRLGEQIVKLLPNGGDVGVFVGTFAADNAQQRLKGIQDVAGPKGIKVAVKKEDGGDRNAARSNVENVLNAYPNVKLLCGLWSYDGPAIAKAIEGAGKKGKVMAAVFDEEQGTLDAIEAGTINVTVVQNPFEIGYQSAKLLYALATQGQGALPKNGEIDTGTQVISSANVKEFRTKLAEMTK